MLQDGEHYCHSLTGLFGKLVFVQRERVGFKEVIKKKLLKKGTNILCKQLLRGNNRSCLKGNMTT